MVIMMMNGVHIFSVKTASQQADKHRWQDTITLVQAFS